jgi:hypothetical protein
MNTLLSSRALEAALFAVVVVFTVLSLELHRAWLERGADIAQARRVALLLAFVFFVIADGGVAEFVVVGRPDLVNLGFFLSGIAGLGILSGLMFGRDGDRERRRMAAHDL